MIVEPLPVGWRGRKGEDGKWHKQYESTGEEKANCLTTAQTDSMVAEPIRVGGMPRPNGELSTSQAKRVYSIEGKSVNLTAHGGGEGAKTGMYAVPAYYPYAEPIEWDDEGKPIKAKSYADGKNYTVYTVENGVITIKDKQYPIKLPDGFYIIRKLTPVECERLQTLPDGYTSAVSDAQRYKGLGNGWTAEVIIHILNGALKDVPRDEEIVVLSMYDGIGTGRYCLDAMGFTNVRYYAYEIDKYAKQISMSNYPDIIQCGDAFDIRHPDWTIGY
jgi:DNA (cytosine-5)-methyltransferase 3A